MSERKNILFRFNDPALEQHINENIERYRKGDMTLTLADKNGTPLIGASVSLTQKSHEFRFGANLFMLDELETEEKNNAYKKYFSELFNMATLPFYWRDTEPEKGKTRYEKDSPKIYRRPPVELCLEFCKENGIEPREHALAYDRMFPLWLKGADTETVKTELERRFAEIGKRYADKIDTIEVTNEMFWDSQNITDFYYDPEYVEWCFKVARTYFPNNKLSINEAPNFTFGETLNENSKYIRQIREALENGAPIDAVGAQMHFFYKREMEENMTRTTLDPAKVLGNLDMLASFGKPVQITEITFPAFTDEAEDEAVQAEMLEKMYTLWFSHPAVEQIIYWNLVDGYAHVWSNDQAVIRASMGDMTRGENVYRGGLLRFDLSPKPAYCKLKELLTKTWHTEETLMTDTVGEAHFRGFYGKYELAVSKDGQTKVFEIDLLKNGENKIDLEW